MNEGIYEHLKKLCEQIGFSLSHMGCEHYRINGCDQTWDYNKDDVLSALNGLINDVNNLKNRDDMVKAVLLVCDGGGVGRFEVISLINKWFNIGDEKK